MSIYICLFHDYPRLLIAADTVNLSCFVYTFTFLLFVVFLSITLSCHNLKLLLFTTWSYTSFKPKLYYYLKHLFNQTNRSLSLISTTTNPFFCLSILKVYQTQPLLLIVTNESNQQILAQRRDYFD